MNRGDLCTFPGALSYPDGEIEETDEGIFLHFAFDYNRHDAIYMKVELPK